jgi:hypothetical protein
VPAVLLQQFSVEKLLKMCQEFPSILPAYASKGSDAKRRGFGGSLAPMPQISSLQQRFVGTYPFPKLRTFEPRSRCRYLPQFPHIAFGFERSNCAPTPPLQPSSPVTDCPKEDGKAHRVGCRYFPISSGTPFCEGENDILIMC